MSHTKTLQRCSQTSLTHHWTEDNRDLEVETDNDISDPDRTCKTGHLSAGQNKPQFHVQITQYHLFAMSLFTLTTMDIHTWHALFYTNDIDSPIMLLENGLDVTCVAILQEDKKFQQTAYLINTAQDLQLNSKGASSQMWSSLLIWCMLITSGILLLGLSPLKKKNIHFDHKWNLLPWIVPTQGKTLTLGFHGAKNLNHNTNPCE